MARRQESSNPALTRIPAFAGAGRRSASAAPYAPPPGGIDYRKPESFEASYGAPSAGPLQTGRMTVDDVVVRTAIMIATVFAFAAVTWVADLEALSFPAAIVGLVLGLVITFKQITNPAAILSYAAVEGVFLGGISKVIGSAVGDTGIVVQALIGTAGVAAVMLGLYKSGRIRVTPQFQKVVIMATLGFFVLIMANLVFSLFSGGAGLRGGALGLVVGVVAIGLASLNLVLDFDLIEKAAAQGAPERYGWLAAFGLVVTLVWLYVEILRLLAVLQGRD